MGWSLYFDTLCHIISYKNCPVRAQRSSPVIIYKVSVAKSDFHEVLKSTKVTKKLGKANLVIEEVEFHYAAGELKVIVVGSERVVAAKGSGRWSTCIPLLRYQALSKLPPIADPLIIEYDPQNKRLKIGTTSFSTPY